MSFKHATFDTVSSTSVSPEDDRSALSLLTEPIATWWQTVRTQKQTPTAQQADRLQQRFDRLAALAHATEQQHGVKAVIYTFYLGCVACHLADHLFISGYPYQNAHRLMTAQDLASKCLMSQPLGRRLRRYLALNGSDNTAHLHHAARSTSGRGSVKETLLQQLATTDNQLDSSDSPGCTPPLSQRDLDALDSFYQSNNTEAAD